MNIEAYNIGNYVVNNYILRTPLGIIAIDTGYPGDEARFLQRFQKRWPLSELNYIFLTHHHDDHAGFLGALMGRCDAKVILHPAALAPLRSGKSEEPPGAGYSSWPASLFSKFKKEFTFPPVDLGDRAIVLKGEDDQLFEQLGLQLHILYLPGHTADSIGLFCTQSGALFCGDAAMNAVISVARHTIWIEDPVSFGQSWDKMLAMSPNKIYPSHGSPFLPQALVKYRHFLDQRKLIPPAK